MLPHYGNGRKKRTARLIIQHLAAAATAPSWAAALSVGFRPRFPPSTQSAPHCSTDSRRPTSRKVRGAAEQQIKQYRQCWMALGGGYMGAERETLSVRLRDSARLTCRGHPTREAGGFLQLRELQ